MPDNNKMNQGQNDLNKSQKPGGSEKVSSPDQNKNKNPNQKIDQDSDIGSRQTSSNKPDANRVNQGQGGQGNQGNLGNQSNMDRDPNK